MSKSGASLGRYKVVVWARVWTTTKWWFGREFGLLQSGGLGASLGCQKWWFGRELGLLQSGGLSVSLGCHKVVVWT